MTEDLKRILSELVGLTNQWNRGQLSNEDEFISGITKLNEDLAAELKSPTPEQTSPE